jgi:iron complex transport system substrate-binding protein
MNRFEGWKQADIDELRENVAPYFGNTIFTHEYPWHDYRYYTLYEAFGKLAEAFQRQDRHRQFVAVHDHLVNDVRSRLPARSDRPSVAVVYPQPVEQPESFLPYPIGQGTTFAHMNTLGLKDAFGENTNSFTNDRGQVDYETLLEIDPDVLLLLGNETKSAEEFRNTVLSYLRTQNIASQLTAVENGDVYRAGGLYQGPIINLFLIERLGHQLYSDTFGSDRLFDRQRVANIVKGNF